jgi:hypothetical protein
MPEEKTQMGFINERIPEEEKKKFTFPVMTYPDGDTPTLRKWTIDREREAYMVHTKTGGGASRYSKDRFLCHELAKESDRN